ncbi:MAG: signal peptidase I [Chloroflexota bacterium]|nr:signal peptidase I [Chloroflexota bacterium]
MRSFFFEILETILIALAVFLIVSTSIQTVRVQGLSMDPTVTHGQFLLVNKLVSFDFSFLPSEEHIDSDNSRISLFSYPSPGDLIVFHLSDDPERDMVKRVIGVPGDMVRMVDGFVYVNDILLQEPYVTNRGSSFVSPEIIRSGHYFVLGDNRTASSDSRLVGQIPQSNIVGKVWLTFWPIANFGTLRATNGLFE